MNPHRTPGVLDPCPGCSRSMARLRVYFRANGRTSPEFCSEACLNKWRAENPEPTEATADVKRWVAPPPKPAPMVGALADEVASPIAFLVGLGACLLAVAVGAVVLGCTSLTVPIRATNATRATAVELIAVVDAVCTEPARAALEARLSPEASAAEAERLEALGCPEAWRAQTAVSEAHSSMVALLTAIQAGQCQATVAAPAPARCDIARATMALVEAVARLARAVDALEGGR